MVNAKSEYGFSLFCLAREQKRIDDYAECLLQVEKAVSENPDWLSLLRSPAIPLGERLGLIDKVFHDLAVKEVLNLLKLLCEKGQIQILPECIAEFCLLVQEWKKHIPAEVRFAFPLTDEQKEKLVKKIEKMTGKIPEMTYIEDPSLIGGIRVKIEDAVLDGSVSANLGALKEVIKG